MAPDLDVSDVKDAARTAASTRTFRMIARAGYAANGIIHVLLGGLVLVVAFGGDGQTSQSGAFRAVAEAPLGFALLWAIAGALWALAAWQLVQGLLVGHLDGTEKWKERLSSWARAVTYAVIGGIAASVALGSRPDGEESTDQASSGVLSLPGGVFILGGVGAAIAAVGIGFVVIGVRRSFRQKLRMPAGALGRTVTVVGVIGYIAKGFALAIVGVLAIVAAWTADPEQAGGTDQAISTLIQMPFGPVLVAAVGVGLVAFAVFLGFRAVYAKLDD